MYQSLSFNLNLLLAKLTAISRIAVRLAGAAIALAALITTVGILARYVLGITIRGVDEIPVYLFSAGTAWSLSYVLIKRSHIRIDVLYGMFPSRLQRVLDIVSLFALLLFIVPVVAQAFKVFEQSWVRGSISASTLGAPLWIPQLGWLTGLAFFAFVTATLLTTVLVEAWGGRWDRVADTAGCQAASDEAMVEASGVIQATAEPLKAERARSL